MPIFTESVMRGMGSLAIAPYESKPLRLKSRVCSRIRIFTSDSDAFELLGTKLFAMSPLESDWMAIGNDLRLGHILFLIEENTDVEGHSKEQGRDRETEAISKH